MSDGFFGESGTRSAIDVAALLDSDIPGLTARLVDMGCLVSFGSTRDGGALSITVTNESDRARSYFRDAAEACDWLRVGIDALERRGGHTNGEQPPGVQKPARQARKRA